MKPKVSIVVPIYNMENYLSRCLDSLLAQDLIDLEIIAVNDGSTDRSLNILQDYADKDDRIVVVDKENGGVSSARNEGILISRGEYIGFVDPDDWVDCQMYEALYTAAMQENADIVMCTYVREFGNHAKEKVFPFPNRICLRNDEVHKLIMRRLVGPLNEEIANPEYLDAWGTVWSKIYRADLIKENGLKFVDLHIVGTNEDSLFNIHAFYFTKTFVFVNEPFYHYWRANLKSLTAGYKPHLVDQWFKLYGLIEGFLKDKNLKEEFHLALHNRICLGTLGLGLNTVSEANNVSGFMKVKKLSSILNDHRIQRSFKQFEMKHFSIVWWAFYSCAKLRFSLGFYFMLMSINWLRKVVR